MRELDVLLVAYLDERYDRAPDKEKAAFRAFIELPDPELMSYLLQNEQPAPEFANVVNAILGGTDS